MSNVDKNKLLKELMTKQIKNIPNENKLKYADMKRICKYINNSIFDENVCCIWQGYITNSNNFNKGTYINFYYRKKKVALHRLLYTNFVEILSKNEYLKFNCPNKGKCCNIHHLKKFEYNRSANKKIEISEKKKRKKKDSFKIINKNNINDINSLHIEFD
jgi:hypothetical protein